MRVQTFSPYFQLKFFFLFAAVLGVTVLPIATEQVQWSPAMPVQKQSADLVETPLSFEVNKGQTDPSVVYLTRSLGGTLFFRKNDVVLSLPKGIAQPSLQENEIQSRKSIQENIPLQLHFLNANPNTLLVGTNKQAGIVNYMIGNNPADWQTNIPTYADLLYEQLYPGIDLFYEGTNSQLKGTYLVAPHSDPLQIRWRYTDADNVWIDPSTGELHISIGETQSISLVEQPPIAWQEIEGKHVPVKVSYATSADGSVHFVLGSYNPRYALTIDPTLTYASYLGGNSADYAYDIAVDAQGNFYVTGATGSTDFPLANSAPPKLSGDGDLFVTKFNAAGATLAYSTYLGGNSSDVGFGIAVDGEGNAYVTGESWSSNFPVVNPMPPNDPGIQQDVIVFKLNQAGNNLVYSTYLGGHNSQTGWDIAVDASGNAYLTGHTISSTFPVKNAFQAQMKGGRDAFVTKIDPTGSGLVYSSFLGGSGDLDYGFSIAIDSAGNAYVTGQATENDFPTVNAFQSTPGGFGEAFVTKVNPSGTALIYSTYLGGDVNEQGRSIAVDSGGNAYIAGWTESTNFPTANAYQVNNRGFADVFVTKLNAAGSALVYSTYLGGSNPDGSYDANIAVDGTGNAYVAGNTESPDFPTVNAIQPVYGGYESDVFVTRFNALGSALLYSTFLGGTSRAYGLGDYARGVAIDGSGNTYVTGYTFASNFPLAGASYQTTNRGNYDAFVAVINNEPSILPTPTASLTPTRTLILSPTPSQTSTPASKSTLTPTPLLTSTLTATPDAQLADFTLEVSPASHAVRWQQTASYSIQLVRLNGFNSNIQLSVSGVPNRTNAVFTNNPISPGPDTNVQFSRLDITPQRKAPTGTFTLTITAVGGGKTHSQTVTLSISP